MPIVTKEDFVHLNHLFGNHQFANLLQYIQFSNPSLFTIHFGNLIVHRIMTSSTSSPDSHTKETDRWLERDRLQTERGCWLRDREVCIPKINIVLLRRCNFVVNII